jgi:hypothetical protein
MLSFENLKTPEEAFAVGFLGETVEKHIRLPARRGTYDERCIW